MTKTGPHGKDPMLYDEFLNNEAIFIYRLRFRSAQVSVNSPDTLNFARNDIAGEKDGVQQRRYSTLFEQAASKGSHAQALMQLKTEIEGIGIAYDSTFCITYVRSHDPMMCCASINDKLVSTKSINGRCSD